MTFYTQLFILRLEYGLRIVKFSVFSILFLYFGHDKMPPQNGNANNFFLNYWIKIRIWGNCSPQRHLSCIEILGNIENVFFMKFTSQFNDPERGPPHVFWEF